MCADLALQTPKVNAAAARGLHGLGVCCALAAGAWLGAAEAPAKLVTASLSPFLVSLAMVAGVFVARWTIPTMLKGGAYIFGDLREKPHLLVWAVLAGALWAVANVLTVFAIRDVGLSIAFPLWNFNSLVGVFWGWFFFRELRGAGARNIAKVWGGAIAIAGGAVLLALATSGQHGSFTHRAAQGILAALGAGLLWGTMYVPYRKAYLSGMNPLSFVTVFTAGELLTSLILAVQFEGGVAETLRQLSVARPALFWLFLGGLFWVIGDLFQQFAAKYIGIGRGIPLSNTNQIWGLAWGALVFGELHGKGSAAQIMVVAGSGVMILGAVAISTALAPEGEIESRRQATLRECDRYNLDFQQVERAVTGDDPLAERVSAWAWWDSIIVALALAVFVLLAHGAGRPPIHLNMPWVAALVAVSLGLLLSSGLILWKRTRFS